MKKIYIKTMGCQMNVYDSGRILDAMAVLGYHETDNPNDADILMINTCHIREKASDKVFSGLGRFQEIKDTRAKAGKSTLIGLAGCVVQALGDTVLSKTKYVDFAVGPQSYHLLPEIITKFDRTRGRTVVANFTSDEKFDALPKITARGRTAFLAIQEGCDNFCAYCVVPYTRGCEYSRSAAEILDEAKHLVATGACEITLLGQNVNCWHGKGLNGKPWKLNQLFDELVKIHGLERIRYTTSYPADVTEDMIMAHVKHAKVMPYIHLPIQSGSDKILQAMNRRYTVDQYLKLIDRIRELKPDMAISSDFIVGFPGETEEDFLQTLEIIRRVGYAQAFSFKYSARPGTPASLMKNQIAEDVKEDRLARLQTALLESQKAFNKKFVGQTVPVLLVEKGQKSGQLLGYSPFLQNVHVAADEKLLGQIVNLKIKSATASSLTGEIHATR